MKQYEFKLVFLDRRDEGSNALSTLNALGGEGWHVVHVREDVQHERSLVAFLERERGG
ncbi:hypothetical protein WPS_32450 [Vulcanimicrobium alpinum]|uniref:DUF4177 domain-containing protein n=1 Tax=Vulcanimicrobium alpinum TaxID=3016050 RepID=A0AAN1XZ03_UNVUL|nr:hypothetical protein [Vulcanimicrobium alpinum]BDE07969.1 hypothetical protein WPS_32450 [Vulcanimicrobium alpinum]